MDTENPQPHFVVYEYLVNQPINITVEQLNTLLENNPERRPQVFIPHVQIIQQIFSDYMASQEPQLLSEEEFEKLKKYNKRFDCSICLESKCRGRELDCEHLFCNKCIKEWLTTKNTNCPIC